MAEPIVTTDAMAPDAGGTAEQRIAVATQWQLMWWRFRKHKLAVGGTLVLVAFYVVALFADFFAYCDPQESDAQRSLIAPQSIHWFDDGRFSPHVFGLKGTRDPVTFKRVYVPDPERKVPLVFFGRGEPYLFLVFIPMDRHLFAVEGAKAGETLFLMGTDMQGRDLWSRLMYATRTSMTIGLVSVALSLVLGVVLTRKGPGRRFGKCTARPVIWRSIAEGSPSGGCWSATWFCRMGWPEPVRLCVSWPGKSPPGRM